jgi:hypothetical protein
MLNSRLPVLPASTDSGCVYVVKSNGAYKIGFTRKSLERRVRDAGGELVLTIPTGQQPSVLEYLVNQHFAAKRLPNYKENDGGKREWFALDAADLNWPRGLSASLSCSD